MTQESMIMISSTYLMIALMLSLQVYIGLRTMLFGIVLPMEALQDTAVHAIRRSYALLTSGFAVVIGGACFLWVRHQPAQILLIWMTAILLLVIASCFAIWISRISAQRLKAARGWQVVMQTKRAASLVVGRTQGTVLSSWWYLVNVAVMALCIFFAIARWDTIPQWMYFGNYEIYKSVWTVFMLNILQAVNIIILVGYNRMISRARTSLDPQDREGSLQKQLKYKKTHSILAWGASLLSLVFVGVVQAIMLYGWKENLLFLSGMSLWVALFLALIGVMLYLRIKGIDQLRDLPSMEDRHWKWLGNIYVNPEDPAFMVPNINGFGWTLNMAKPLGKIIATAIIAVPVIDIFIFLPILDK